MPDEKIPSSERKQFTDWWQVFTGSEVSWSFLPRRIRAFYTDNPFYKIWVEQGKPTAEQWQTAFKPVTDISGRPIQWARIPVKGTELKFLKSAGNLSSKEQKVYEEKIGAVIWKLVDAGILTKREGDNYYADMLVKPVETFAKLLDSLRSPDELEAVLGVFASQGIITAQESAGLLQETQQEAERKIAEKLKGLGVSPELRDYLGQFTSETDLADRIGQLKTDPETKNKIYDAIKKIATTGMGIRAAEKARREEFKLTPAQELKRAQDVRDFTWELTQTQLDPRVSAQDKDLILKTFDEAAFLPENLPQSKYLLDQIKQRTELGAKAGGAFGDVAMTNINRLQAEMEGEARERATGRPMPEALGVAESFLKGAEIPGEGTRLRSFIESKIPETFESTRQARAAWWRRMNPERGETYDEARAGLQREIEQYRGLRETAPETEMLGTTYWGPGGLRAFAEGAYQRAVSSLEGLKPEGFWTPEPVKPEEDPFKKALRERQFRSEYFRQPGAGIVSRLQPSIRFR